ncbi:vanadium-dependent haloperoxidase [Pseudonocardia nigra]|uniref:vanadium-dependent haloperoxidase n=1 Tax=Pseudonocardia nigra TaxID=1921578 RepID=UPI001C6016EA|nr:vanadium-dependent haloperoxidase [Pseudonocardia nigra]
MPAGLIARSAEYGHRVGERILTWAAEDGYADTVGRAYQPRTGAAQWAPEFGLEAVEPHWGIVRPFALPAADAYQPPPPPAPFSPHPGSAFFHQATRVYQAGLTLTDEQREIALFWSDNARLSGTPAGHWMLIARDLVNQRGWPLDRAAQLYALLAVALADAFTSCWHEKYRTNLLRPDTYIRAHIDPGWRPWVATPVFPEYTSGHSVASRAAATVLTDLAGATAFTDNNHAPGPFAPRSFASFHAAAEEAAISRLYGGIHYPMSIEIGLSQGEQVARHVIDTLYQR